MKLHFSLRLLAALSLTGASYLAQAADFTVAYQTTVDPAKVRSQRRCRTCCMA